MAVNTNGRPRTRLLTLRDVAGDLNVSIKTVRRIIDRHELKVQRVGRAIRVAEDELALFHIRANQADHK